MIEIYGLVGCTPCHKLTKLLDDAKIQYLYTEFDPFDDNDADLIEKMGFDDFQFPVVIVNGQHLDSATPEQYLTYLEQRCGKR